MNAHIVIDYQDGDIRVVGYAAGTVSKYATRYSDVPTDVAAVEERVTDATAGILRALLSDQEPTS